MSMPLIDTSAIDPIFNSAAVLALALAIVIVALTLIRRMRDALNEFDKPEILKQAQKNHLIKRTGDNTWEYVGEYQTPADEEKTKTGPAYDPFTDDDTAPIMTIGDDGELVEVDRH